MCKDCYNRALELIRRTNYDFTTDNEVTNNVVDKDGDFLPSTPERIEEFNYEIR